MDPFAETPSKQKIACHQSNHHNLWFYCTAVESGDAFQTSEDAKDAEGRYKEAMRLQMLEKEEQRVKQAIEEKERGDCEDEKEKVDLDKTLPAAEIEKAAKELVAAGAGIKQKRR